MKLHGKAKGAASGFTLVELMVALALAAVICVSIAVISEQAQQVYDETTRKVEVYNKFRFALIQIERDFSRWIPTSNLEFFVDGRGAGSRRNEHWDPGEQFPDRSDARGPWVVDGGTLGDYDEFAYIEERHYLGTDRNDKDEDVPKIHDAYQAYFRTVTFIDGRMREANVEFKLLDPTSLDANGNPRPPAEVKFENMPELSLYKIVRYHDISYNDLVSQERNFPIVRKYIEICTNITDFKIEYTADNRFDSKASAGLRTPREDAENPAEPAVAAVTLTGQEGVPGETVHRKYFGYGSVKVQKQYPKANVYRAYFGDRQTRTEHRPIRFGWDQMPQCRFAELTPGDKIFIFNQSARGQGGAAAGVVGSVGGRLNFPEGTYTIKTNVAGRLEFVEDIESTEWSRDQTGLSYKAAFLPEAIRITIRVIDDTKKKEAKTLQRVVWIRQKSR